MTLSDKIDLMDDQGIGIYMINAEYVKEFVKELKERTMNTSKLNPIDKARICQEINKLAGDKLI